MGVEVATYIGDFTPSTPGASDLRNQGDDHLRLIKTVLQNTFPSLEKAIYFPTTTAKSADFTVLSTDMNKTFLVTTTGGLINMTLPTLVSGDAGWECFLMKVSFDVNPVMVKPPSGTLSSGAISGLSAARRCIPSKKVSCFWTGSAFVIGRATECGPVGTAVEYHGATLPYGFEWPNGQTLASASTVYPEYNAVIGSGVTLDKRGRFSATLDNLGGSAASRITTAGGGVDGATEGAVGGSQAPTILTTNLPAQTPSGTIGSMSGSVGIPQRSFVGSGSSVSTQFSAASNIGSDNGTLIVSLTSLSATFTGSAFAGQNSTPMKTLPPTIMVPQILVTE